jgi:hypothetical protein
VHDSFFVVLAPAPCLSFDVLLARAHITRKGRETAFVCKLEATGLLAAEIGARGFARPAGRPGRTLKRPYLHGGVAPPRKQVTVHVAQLLDRPDVSIR